MKRILFFLRSRLLAVTILLLPLTPLAHAQESVSGGSGGTSAAGTGASTLAATSSAGQSGDVGAGIKKTLDKLNGLRSSLIQGATSISDRTRKESDKLAFGLGVITLVLAGLRFAATSDPVGAWTDMFDTLIVIGIFASIYVSYTTFAPGIFTWFNDLASLINDGDDIYNVPLTLAKTAGVFFEAVVRALVAGFSNPLKFIDAAIQALLFVLTFIALMVGALIYSWFILLGHFQVAVGIALGPIGVALGFSDYTRKYFTAWLDYMFTGSLYMVVSAVIAQLVSASLLIAIGDVGVIGGDTYIGASYALSMAIILVFVALEIPKISGSIFGTGGGISGGGAMKMLGRGAWGLGGKLAGKK
ncbi:type IV secretion system protein [Cupriavidus sp. WS]|uniref:type IV secretion system protein n=1 Tax=Cupriavidus sp. WS TaxID=1312922 RepID=UPI000490200E|nr:type IV secretion system protein [Cupriavidus sp. WS]